METDSPTTMREDAAAAGRALHLDHLDRRDRRDRRDRLDLAARAALAAPPSLEYDDYPEVVKHPIAIDIAAARIANALHLHLD